MYILFILISCLSTLFAKLMYIIKHYDVPSKKYIFKIQMANENVPWNSSYGTESAGVREGRRDLGRDLGTVMEGYGHS